MTNEDIWPRDLQHRYRIYGRKGDGDPYVIAVTPTVEGIGVAITTLHDEAKEEGSTYGLEYGVFGLMDVCPNGEPSEVGEWIVKCWEKGP